MASLARSVTGLALCGLTNARSKEALARFDGTLARWNDTLARSSI